jgi:tetratricopeptide (TPR) repeat protein
MDWWIWLGIIAGVITILSTLPKIRRYLKVFFRPAILRCFRRNKEMKGTVSELNTTLRTNRDAGSENISVQIPIPDKSFGYAGIQITVEYLNGLPTSERSLRDRFEKATYLKGSREFIEAIELYKECLEYAVIPEQKVAIYIQIGSCYGALFQNTESMKYYNEAVGLADKYRDEKGLEAGLLNLGSVYSERGNVNDAMDCFHRALEINKQTGNKDSKARILLNLGQVYVDKGRTDEGMSEFRTVLRMNSDIGSKKIEGFAYYGMGGLYYRKDTKRSLRYFRKALDVFREIKEVEAEASALDSLGLAYLINNEKTECLDCLKSALEICRTIGNRAGEVRVLDSMAFVYLLEEDAEKAREYLEESVRIASGEEDTRHLTIMGIYHRMTGDKAKATEYFEKSERETESSN